MKFIITTAALAATASAAVIDDSYSNPSAPTQFGYEVFVTLDAVDSWSSITSVGGWSYMDLQAGANPNRGWGHAATWYLVELTADTTFNITMAWNDSQGGQEGRPGFTIYDGESLLHDTSQLHTYSNNGIDMVALNSPWDSNSPALGFVGNGVNLSGDEVSGSFSLSAGRYTIALGNAHDSSTSAVGREYNLTFATVPEPTAALLSLLGALPLLRRRR